NCRPELRVSKYCIEVRDVLSVGVKALTDAIASADIVCIDEVGPMELRVKELRNAIVNALRSSKNVLAVIHWRLDDRGIVELVKSAIKYEVNVGNRDILPNMISDILLRSLSSSKT
ncbi:MAG: nucleoside-triphosphatase, partial [Sulfolobales archaeon]